MRIDLTPFFQAAIVLISAIITYKLVPLIKSKASKQQFENLTAAAKVAVYAAEQMIAHGSNSEKLSYAIAQVQAAGFDIDIETIRAAVEKAVYDLKTEPVIITGSGEITGLPADEEDTGGDKEELHFN